jgi:DNA invertase Pin-like site-specific DNA recombinase
MEAPMKAALYARISTADGRQDVENQLAELRRFAVAQGWETTNEYIDRESGGKADRAEFRRMFTDAARRRFDLVLVWALDRLTREGVAETFEYIKRLTRHGVQFVSFTEEHFRTTGPAGELMIAVAAWIAKQERIRISERVRAGLARARLQGTRSGRAVGRPKVVFNRDEAIRLRREGWSWREISRKLRVGSTTIRSFYKKGKPTDSEPTEGSEETPNDDPLIESVTERTTSESNSTREAKND